MMRADLHLTLADGTDVGYAEVGDPDGAPVLHLHGSPSCRLEVTAPALREAAESLGVRLIAPDRPGMGLSTFSRYSTADYPRQVRGFADALGLERFAITAVSGGGRYACACAWQLGDRVGRVALVSTTCSFDLPGARQPGARRTGRPTPWPCASHGRSGSISPSSVVRCGATPHRACRCSPSWGPPTGTSSPARTASSYCDG
jgi:pimeloyl-ACP methyl ester carboxylesterase